MQAKHSRPWRLLPLLAGLALLGIFLTWSLWPEQVAPHTARELFRPWQSPNPKHPLGTNDMGYDLFSELIFAARSTLWVGLCSAGLSLLLGSVAGLLTGWWQGWRSSLLELVTSVFLLIPLLPSAIVVAALLGPGNGNLILVIGLLGWSSTARAVAAETQALRRRPFVQSLELLAIPHWRILLRHLLPNLAPVILSRFVLSVSACIMTEATLSFLGLGDPTRVTWGGMVSLAYKRGGFARGAANWFAAPGLCIMLTTLAFALLGRYFEERERMVTNDG